MSAGTVLQNASLPVRTGDFGNTVYLAMKA